jgi:phospholipase C
VPACVPNNAGSLGPNWAGYTGTTAAYIPTIFDELDAAGLSWKLYGGDGAPVGDKMYQQSGWQWTICPYFAECLYSSQRNNLQSAAQIETDAASSHLPSFSIVTPTSSESQHNGWDMTEGDNFIGQVVSSLQKSRQWGSTAVFITYDDCGCFYDHVNPLQYNATWGILVTLVIVSPYVTAGYTDSTPTTFAGILAFAETMLGVPPLNSNDASAYNYLNAFCWRPAAQHCVRAGVAPVTLISQATTPYTAAERAAQEVDARDDT